MYFEDIFNRAKEYWAEPIEVGKVGEFYTENIEDKHQPTDYEISEWIDVINWSIAIILTKKEDQLTGGLLSINDISVRSIEERLRYDLKNQLSDKLLKNYMGFKPSLS